jgi:hypothetical protein
MEDEKNQNVDTQTTTENNAQANKEQGAVNKNEGSKGNEQTKTKSKNGITKNDDGSLTFESQKKLEEFAKKMFAKGADKAEKGKTSEEVQEQQEETTQDEEVREKNVATIDYTDKIALAMAKAGVDVKKVERAARLVDLSKILENGILDTKKLEDEINAVIAEFPELKNATQEEKEEKGFKFGATEGDSNQGQRTKKSIPTKRWNRFNSF